MRAASRASRTPCDSRHDDRVGVADRVLEALRGRRDVWIVDCDVGELALKEPDELVGQRVALIVGVALEREAEDRDLAAVQGSEPARHALHEE